MRLRLNRKFGEDLRSLTALRRLRGLLTHAERALVRHRPAGKVTRKGPAIDFNGHWQNELGSYMDLVVTGSQLTGQYVSAVSSSGGPTPPYPLQGTVGDDLISFTVNWDGIFITSWVGHGVFDKQSNQIQILTLWHLVMTVANETDPANQWKTVEAGADTFTFVPAKK